MKCNLLLHCGSRAVEREILEQVYTPEPTLTWHPIPHILLLELTEKALKDAGLEIVEEAHALSRDMRRYFGLIQLQNEQADEHAWVVGIRNSGDRRFPAGLVCGAQVICCDNLVFSGQVVVHRKHTIHIVRDLPSLVRKAVDELIGQWQSQDRRFQLYKAREISDREAHDLTIRALDAGAITTRQIPSVLGEWRSPSYPSFEPRNLWSWVNAVTHELRGRLDVLPGRSRALYEVCDSLVGVN